MHYNKKKIEGNAMENKKVIFLGIGIIGVIILTLSISYAYWRISVF